MNCKPDGYYISRPPFTHLRNTLHSNLPTHAKSIIFHPTFGFFLFVLIEFPVLIIIDIVLAVKPNIQQHFLVRSWTTRFAQSLAIENLFEPMNDWHAFAAPQINGHGELKQMDGRSLQKNINKINKRKSNDTLQPTAYSPQPTTYIHSWSIYFSLPINCGYIGYRNEK